PTLRGYAGRAFGPGPAASFLVGGTGLGRSEHGRSRANTRELKVHRRHMIAVTLSAAWQLSCASGSASSGATSAPVQREPILVASIFSLSGEAREDNLGAVEGVRFAVEEANARGGVLGSQLKLIEIDNQSTVEGARAAA